MSPTLQLFITEFALGISAWTVIAVVWVYPWLKTKSKVDALAIMLAPQMMRFIGISLLIPGLVGPDMPKELAQQIAWGDATTSALAMIGILFLRSGWKGAIGFAWFVNLLGFTDLLLSVGRGSAVDISTHLHGAWYVPTLAVPFTLTSHLVAFLILIKHKSI